MVRQMANPQLSRRERQIMDIAFRRGSATAADIMREMSEPPSYSAVRALLRILVDKGHLKFQQEGPRYVYSPTVSRRKARAGALEHLVRTFFDGSAAQAVTALLDSSQGRLSRAELDELAALIEAAREKDR